MRTRNELESMVAHNENRIIPLYGSFAIHIVLFAQIQNSALLEIELPAYVAGALDSTYATPASI